MDFLATQYTAQTVATATGATPKQITDWCNQGLVTGKREPLGRGHKRLFPWFNVMEIAGALALMEVGVKSPGDAFRISMLFASGDDAPARWSNADKMGESKPSRLPGVPYPYLDGSTYLLVSHGEGRVVSAKDGQIDLKAFRPRRDGLIGFIALNMTEVFEHVTSNMGLDPRTVLDEVYTQLGRAR